MDTGIKHEVIKEKRKALGLTQKQVGGKAGIRHNRLCLIERGTTQIYVSQLVRLAAALNVPVEELINRN